MPVWERVNVFAEGLSKCIEIVALFWQSAMRAEYLLSSCGQSMRRQW